MQLFPLTVNFPAAFAFVRHNGDILGDYEEGIPISQSAHNSQDGKWPKHTMEKRKTRLTTSEMKWLQTRARLRLAGEGAVRFVVERSARAGTTVMVVQEPVEMVAPRAGRE